LRASGPDNPRIYSCPTCHTRQVLTRRDKELGYQCNSCADQQERGGY
jgi:ribosomal protein L37AE/L43A